MRTKITILSAAALLAAGLLSSNAQVYSANVVGYANVRAGNGITPTSNPLKANGTPINSATNVIPNADGHLDGLAFLSFFTGTVFTPELQFDSTSPTGFSDIGGTPQSTPLLPIGQGFMLRNATGAPFTNTFVGEVQGWNNVALTFSNSISIPSSSQALLISSPLPIGGNLNTNLQFANPGGIYDGVVFVETLTKPATVNSPQVYFDSTSLTGFSDFGGNPVAAPVFNIGDTFYIFNQSGSTIVWKQQLP